MIDQWIPQEDEQVTVDPRTKSRTIHTGITYPDGSQGFVIIGRMENTAWEPTKVIKRVIIEYNDKIQEGSQGVLVGESGNQQRQEVFRGAQEENRSSEQRQHIVVEGQKKKSDVGGKNIGGKIRTEIVVGNARKDEAKRKKRSR